MATKEDILEQLVEEYLTYKGYFVRHNIKFLPRRDHPDYITNQDSNHSDIDVLAIHPLRNGPERVMAVSCKSWQSGFRINTELSAITENKKIRGREAWRGFRELTIPKWSEAFCDKVRCTSGSEQFTYVLAVTKVNGTSEQWLKHQPFIEAMQGNPLAFLTVSDMLDEISSEINTTLASTEIGRMLQIIKASGLTKF